MARVFLDANILIDLVEERRSIKKRDLDDHQIFISPLSCHILLYVMKRKIPYKKLEKVVEQFSMVPVDEGIARNSLIGPTSDFEDNIQLHSAAEAECDLFLTADEKLIKLKFFGKTKIADKI